MDEGSAYQVIGLSLDIIGFGMVATEYVRSLSEMAQDQSRRVTTEKAALETLEQSDGDGHVYRIAGHGEGAAVWISGSQLSEVDQAKLRTGNEAFKELILSRRLSIRNSIFILGLELITIGFCMQILGVYVAE